MNMFNKLARFLFLILAGAALILSAQPARGQTFGDVFVSFPAAANVSSNAVTGGAGLLRTLQWINTSTNVARIKWYDASTTTTNIVRAAYTSYSPYSTNWNSVSTNAYGIVVTNTFSGVYYAATSNLAVTNERPRLLEFVVPAASNVSLTDLNLSFSKGLTVVADNAGTYVLTYDRP